MVLNPGAPPPSDFAELFYMNRAEQQFIIDQLRKDKIIYATEACATVLVSILGLLFSSMYFQGLLRDVVNVLSLFMGVGYAIFMGISNFFRLKKIQKLEKELQ